MRVACFHAIAAMALGLVQRLVCLLQRRFQGHVLGDLTTPMLMVRPKVLPSAAADQAAGSR
jgi:hypothetical protein